MDGEIVARLLVYVDDIVVSGTKMDPRGLEHGTVDLDLQV